MKTALDALAGQVESQRNFEAPPLHLWHPPFSGDIAIRISAQGSWYHEQGKIERASLVRLFASILRREEDGEYYLVTPNEKWRIEVELHPLQVTDFDVLDTAEGRMLQATLNTDRQILVNKSHPLFPCPAMEGVAALRLPHGLTAACTRAAWYRLVNLAEYQEGCLILRSGNFELHLPAT